MEAMLQRMMKRYPLVILMGVMLVAVALIVGAVNAGNVAQYYGVDKFARESSPDLAAVRAGIESTVIWLPYLKFLGVGMILAGIVMALGIIATRLLTMAARVMESVPAEARLPVPGRPATVMSMRLFMMLGVLILIVGLILAIGVAATAAAVYGNPVVAIDAAATGSPLLTDLARVHAAETWLEAFKFLGIASLFLGIVNGLATILYALRKQRELIPSVIDRLPARHAAHAAD